MDNGYIEARTIPEECPFWDRSVTLGRVYEGKLRFVYNKGDKKVALLTALVDMKNGAVFFVAWTGKWRTDVFTVSEEDIARWTDD